MRRLCDEGVRPYLGRSRLVGESPTAVPQREVSKGRSSRRRSRCGHKARAKGRTRESDRGHEERHKAMRQMLEQSGRASDEACGPLLEHLGTGSAKQKAGTGGLLEAALTRQNLQAAWKRVKANKGAAGVDGLDIEQTAQGIRQHWPGVVDVDLAKFFDRVNHDILIDRLRKRIEDAGVLRLIRAYLNAGIMDAGVVVDRHLGTPQGGPRSPLLANVLLDEVDKALEARGYSFERYADDCNVYVGSVKAGERVMVYLRTLYAGLRLQINEAKSAVAQRLRAQVPGLCVVRHRLRAIQLKHWKRPKTIYRELRALWGQRKT